MKFKEFITSKWGKVSTAVSAGIASMSTFVVAHAAEVDEGVSAAKSLLGEAQKTLNIGNVVAILGAGIGAVLGLFLAWWGARKLFGMLKGALTKGKASL